MISGSVSLVPSNKGTSLPSVQLCTTTIGRIRLIPQVRCNFIISLSLHKPFAADGPKAKGLRPFADRQKVISEVALSKNATNASSDQRSSKVQWGATAGTTTWITLPSCYTSLIQKGIGSSQRNKSVPCIGGEHSLCQHPVCVMQQASAFLMSLFIICCKVLHFRAIIIFQEDNVSSSEEVIF